MRYFEWNKEKNKKLMQERGVSFEMVVACIENGEILDRLRHTNRKKYPNQRIYVVEIGGYAYAVPFIEDEKKIFLKTVIPSRKFTKKYLKK